MTLAPQQNAINIVMVLDAVERRDKEAMTALYHPQIEFRFPEQLPYGGCHTGSGVAALGELFTSVWDALQPTPDDRKLEYRVIAASNDDVITRYFLKGRNRRGRTIRSDTLARYTMRAGLLVRAQMYHYELAELVDFLSDSAG